MRNIKKYEFRLLLNIYKNIQLINLEKVFA